jgi:DNA-directed RNA polymerase subunit M/transcription elongation factor TFIIS
MTHEIADREIKKPIEGKKRIYLQCNQCEYTATNSRSLNRHKKSRMENGDGFFAKDIMEDMPSIETEPNTTIPDQEDEKPIKSKKERCHLCDKCEYSAINPGVLSRHKRTAHTNKFFNCEQCNYTTNGDATLLRHNRKKHN